MTFVSMKNIFMPGKQKARYLPLADGYRAFCLAGMLTVHTGRYAHVIFV